LSIKLDNISEVIVFGGSGFIGSRLCSRFIKSNTPFKILDKNESFRFKKHYFFADVRSLRDIDLNIDSSAHKVLINLAAEHRDDVYPKSLYHDVNVQGARNICAIARKKKIRTIIFTSSVAVYGFSRNETSEKCRARPFNDYGRTKYEAEKIYKLWQSEESKSRTLVIIRPTVVFGEQNRGNVYNLFRQIATNNFFMIGDGNNKKSIAYVENVAAFIEYSINFKPGTHVFNYVDKPDFSMNELVNFVKKALNHKPGNVPHIPIMIGIIIGRLFDFFSFISRKKLILSYIRIKKFCSNSTYKSSVSSTGFKANTPLDQAITDTIKYEFLKKNKKSQVFFSE
jgi:nucleoside-diphosphate-sugar epimerase